MRCIFVFTVVLIVVCQNVLSQKIQYFGEEDFYASRRPYDFIYPNNGNRKFIDLVNTDNGLGIFKINIKTHIIRDTFVVNQLNVEISSDSAKSWQSIYRMPSDSEVYQYQIDLPAENMNYGLEIYDQNNILIFGKDTTTFLLYLKNKDNAWAVQEFIRFNNKDIVPLEALWLNKKECLFLYKDINKNFYRIIKTDDNWKTFKDVYTSYYSREYNTLNILPELKYLRKNKNVIKSEILVFHHLYNNELILTNEHFDKFQVIDFVNNRKIIGLEVFSDSTFFILTKELKKVNDKNQNVFSILKTSNQGNSWIELYSEVNNSRNPFFYFQVKDEENFVVVGDFFVDSTNKKYSIKYTTNAGNSWNLITLTTNDFISSKLNYFSFSEDSAYVQALFDFQYKYLCNKALFWMWMPPWREKHYDQVNIPFIIKYFNNELFFVKMNLFADTKKYPKKFELNKVYSYRGTDSNYGDSEAKWTLQYGVVKLNEKQLDYPKMSLTNGGKYNPVGDTLKWQKINGAKTYHLRLYKTGILFPYIEEKIIDTLLIDNTLTLPPLKIGYGYVVLNMALNDSSSSLDGSFYFSLPYKMEPLQKISLENLEIPLTNGHDNPLFLPTTTLELKWTKLNNANKYMLYIFEQTSDSSFSYFPTDQNNRGGKVTNKPIVMQENLLIPEYTFKYMKPYNQDYTIKGSKLYSVIIWAENESGIVSEAILANFTAEPYAGLSFKSIISNIFPNPARSTTRISLLQEGDISISAIDVLGREFPLWIGFATAGEMELDVSSLPAGSYTLLINYGTKVEAFKLIKN